METQVILRSCIVVYTDSSCSTSSTRLPMLRLHQSHSSRVSNSRASRFEYTLTTNTGCADDVASIELVNWGTGDEYECSSIPLLPDGTPETSTCGIEKDQMSSGTWGLILVSNNGDDPDSPPFANQRTFSLDVGVQATSTVSFMLRALRLHRELTKMQVTPTMTFNMTTTPTITSQTTSWVVNTTTVNNSLTVTQPAVCNDLYHLNMLD